MTSSPRAPLDLLQARLLAQLAQLPALTMHQPQPWDLSGPLHFLHQGYHLLFLDTTLTPQLAPFLDHTFEKVKLINPRQPAVKITFYDKHKYWLLKNPQISPDRRASEINHYLQLLTTQQRQLTQHSLLPGSAAAGLSRQQQLRALAEQIRQWQLIRDQPQRYELVMSTYYSEYRYWYISWKYALDEVSFANATSHLLSPRRGRGGQLIGTKLNVVFVDVTAISLIHDHQHKQIADYLAGFPLRSQGLKGQLFARPLKTPVLVSGADRL